MSTKILLNALKIEDVCQMLSESIKTNNFELTKILLSDDRFNMEKQDHPTQMENPAQYSAGCDLKPATSLSSNNVSDPYWVVINECPMDYWDQFDIFRTNDNYFKFTIGGQEKELRLSLEGFDESNFQYYDTLKVKYNLGILSVLCEFRKFVASKLVINSDRIRVIDPPDTSFRVRINKHKAEQLISKRELVIKLHLVKTGDDYYEFLFTDV